MDFRAKEKSWLSQMDQVFGANMAGVQPSGDSGFEDKFGSVKILLSKRSKLWWNRSLLEKYKNNKMIPRGLRVKVIPSFPIEDETFIAKWEESCNNCSMFLMQCLIEHNTSTIDSLDLLIDTTLNELRNGYPVDKLQKFEEDLDKSMDSLVKQIQDNQIAKFNRDIKDYQSKRVYMWRRNVVHHSNLRKTSSLSVSSLSGHSDLSSVSTTATNETSRLRDHTFHPYRRNVIHPKRDNKRRNRRL
ncbi:uncharacterized protein [Dendrobates tinctorius]|uniref:uncharacterized protein n=1 Tax=Dendrobates tinctorius TaxID=92724 RepID=UPI003CCA673D